MKVEHIGKYLLSVGALGLCFFAYTQAVAKADLAVRTVVQPLSNLADSQQPMSLWGETQQPLSTESIVSTSSPTSVVMSDETTATTAAETLELPQQPASIPPQFQGEWTANLERCGATAGESRLWIEANYIEFYESGGPVLEVVTQGNVGLTVITELSGEGDTWQDQRSFQLSPDYQTLETSSGFVRYRCP
ncbi:MAG: hypothetical protein AAF572_01225 [Cyanobacteria bacterium P01_B01_bin.77]